MKGKRHRGTHTWKPELRITKFACDPDFGVTTLRKFHLLKLC